MLRTEEPTPGTQHPMTSNTRSPKVFRLGREGIARGERRNLGLPVSESYSGNAVELPVHVWRGARPGPKVLLTSGVHGDELNGIGIIRRLILDAPFKLEAGTLVFVPVVNILGFERHSRYMPDRRDLNRSFPGSQSGSLARRFAFQVFDNLVRKCDFGIDFHTAAVQRANFPNVRGDLTVPGVRRIAEAFGSELVINAPGPNGSLREAATNAGCPTIILEAGKVLEIEPTVTEIGVRGVTNVLLELGMVSGCKRIKPRYQAEFETTKWLRADFGGLLQFHVAPGEIVEEGQLLATNTNLLGQRQNQIDCPASGVVLGMTTLPAVKPGDPICHLAIPKQGIRRIRRALEENRLAGKMRGELSTNVEINQLSEQDSATTVAVPARSSSDS